MYYLHYVIWDGEKEVRFTGDCGMAVKMSSRNEGYKLLKALDYEYHRSGEKSKVARFWFTRVPISDMLGWVSQSMSQEELDAYVANYDKAFQ